MEEAEAVNLLRLRAFADPQTLKLFGDRAKSLLLVAWSATVAGVFLARAEDFVDDRLVNLPVPSSC